MMECNEIGCNISVIVRHWRTVHRDMVIRTYIVRVILLQDPAPALVHLLMALVLAPHAERRIHVHVVAGQIQTDEPLKYYAPPGKGAREENEQARRGAAVRHHVQHGAEFGLLVKVSRRHAVQRIEQAGYAVEERACARVERHVIEGGNGEHDARVAWRRTVSAGTCKAGSGIVPIRLG